MANHTMKLVNLLLLVTLAQLLATAISSDPDLLQDLCVADLASGSAPFTSLHSFFSSFLILLIIRSRRVCKFSCMMHPTKSKDMFGFQVGSALKIVQKIKLKKISRLIFYWSR